MQDLQISRLYSQKLTNDRVLSAFIVERNFPGVVVNPDEQKMGIKGSSTAQIFYNDVKVPVENLIGKTRRRIQDRPEHPAYGTASNWGPMFWAHPRKPITIQ